MEISQKNNSMLKSSESERSSVKEQKECQVKTMIKVMIKVMITYSDLGHLFYPSSQWKTALGGPMEQKVLEDLFGWLSDPVRDFKRLTILSSQTP
jgi:hypothetical protein